MQNFWDTLSEKMKEAFGEVEKRRKSDLVRLGSLPHLLSFLKDMEPEDVLLLLDQVRKIKKRKNLKHPPINADFYDLKALLSAHEQKTLDEVRAFMVKEVEPIVTEAWLSGEFPFQIVDGLRKLNICGITLDSSVGGQGKSNLLEGMIGAGG